MIMIEIASQGGSLAFQNKGWFQSSKAKRRDQLIHNLVHNVSNYPAWGQCLGPVLLLRYLVVLFSRGQGKKKKREWVKKITAYLWHIEVPKSIPIFPSHNQLVFVPALFHATVHNCVTEALPQGNASLVSLFLSTTFPLSPLSSASLQGCPSEQSSLRLSPLPSNFFPSRSFFPNLRCVT